MICSRVDDGRVVWPSPCISPAELAGERAARRAYLALHSARLDGCETPEQRAGIQRLEQAYARAWDSWQRLLVAGVARDGRRVRSA
jgi:hypothetical protein